MNNKKTNQLVKVTFMLFAAWMVSCTPTVKVTTDYDRSADFSRYKTFGMYHMATSLNINDLNAERIWRSIRIEMLKKGYKEDDRTPDLMIEVLGLLQNKRYVSATGAGAYGPYRGARTATVQAHDYKSGSLVIHVVDAKKDKLLWEGKGNADITSRPKNPDEAIGSAIEKILTDLPKATAE